MSGDSSEEKQFVIVADARRRWTREQKQSIVAECAVGQASVSAVARKHNVAANLLFRWRREFGVGGRAVAEKPAFMPVTLPAPSVAAARAVSVPALDSRLIEIDLASGHRLRFDASIDAMALRRVIEVLEGR